WLVDLSIVAVLAPLRWAPLRGASCRGMHPPRVARDRAWGPCGGRTAARAAVRVGHSAAAARGGILGSRRVAVVVRNARRRRGRGALRVRAVIGRVVAVAMVAATTAQHEADGNDR